MADKKTFVMYKSWKDLFVNLPKDMAGELIQAVFCYQDGEKVNIENPALSAIFTMIQGKMSEDEEKYQNKVKANQENGKLGGRPKTQSVNSINEETKNNPKNPVGFSETEVNPKNPDTDTDTDIDNVSVSYTVSVVPDGANIADSTDVESVSAEPTAGDKHRVPYQEIVNLYRQTCPSLPSVRAVSDTRRKLIRSRFHEHGLDAIGIVFEKAEASDFLTGRREPYWTGCNFDWLLKPTNFIKVLEGTYDNRQHAGSKNEFLDLLAEYEQEEGG